MGTTFNRSGSSGSLTLTGELTLLNAGDTRSGLIKALLDADDISVSFEEVRDVDFSCLQLLCSAQRSAVRLKKQLSLRRPLPGIMTKMMDDAGFTRRAGCKLDCGKSCLWTAGSGDEK